MPDTEESSDQTWLLVCCAGLLGFALVSAAVKWPFLVMSTSLVTDLPYKGSPENTLPLHPFAELLKMVLATLIGIMVTAVHKRYHRDKPLTRSLQQAQILLCVAGAMVMVIIGSSLARAFGVAGAAGIVRFRTPVEDPKDSTILFLLIGLGMACGVGLIEVAALGGVFLCLLITVLDRFGEARPRVMILSLVATSREFPNEHVNRVLARSVDFFEPREVLHGNEAVIRYQVTLDPYTSISSLSQELMAGGTAGLKSVSWGEPSKKGG